MKYTTINEFKQSLIKEASRYSKNFLRIKFNSHKNHNPNADILEGWINENAYITYVLDLKSGIESMEYYTGENYSAGPGKSFSRHFQITQIPKKYRALWEELKSIYQTQYKTKSTNESKDYLGKMVTLQDGHTYKVIDIENNIYTLAPEVGEPITLAKEELMRKLEFINEQNYRLSTDFDFEDFDDTDLNGAGAEMAIDELIEEYIDRVISTITKEEYGENFYFLRNNAIREIFRLWKDKMHNTIKENKSRLMAESDEIEINEKLSDVDKAKREWEKIKPRVESMFLKVKEQAAKCSEFGNISVRMPQYRPNDNEVFIYQNLDRIFRHPDEYGAIGRKAENSPKYHKFEDLLSKLDQFITDKMGKYGVSVDVSAG